MSSTSDGATGGGTGKGTMKTEPGKGMRDQQGCYQGQRQGYRKPAVKQPKFEGRCDELKGFIYDCLDPRQADMYAKTMKEIAEYAGQTCKHGADICKAIESLERPRMAPPADPAADASATDRRIWEKKVDTYVKHENIYEQNIENMYSVILGQCTDAMRAKLESQDQFEQVLDDSDAIELLRMIRDITFNFQSQKYEPLSIHESIRWFYLQCQDRYMICQAYLKQFMNSKDVIEHCGGVIGAHPQLVAKALKEMGTDIVWKMFCL